MMAVGFRDSAIYQLENFKALTQLGKISANSMASMKLYRFPPEGHHLQRHAHQKFYSAPLFPGDISLNNNWTVC